MVGFDHFGKILGKIRAWEFGCPYICGMKDIGEITIRVKGKVGNIPISPDNYDVFDLPQVIENVRDMLFPNGRDKTSPVVTYEMRTGSVVHVFKTQMQKVVQFGAVLSLINTTGTLVGLDQATAQAFENMQRISKQQGLDFDFSTSAEKGESPIVSITQTTNYVREETVWADAEFYFYGKLTSAGGKDSASVYLDTEEYGRVHFSANKDYLRDIKGNPLYRFFGVRAAGRQNADTGEIDLKSLKLIAIFDYQRDYDAEYIDGLIKRATPHWEGTNVDEFLLEVRGGAYA